MTDTIDLNSQSGSFPVYVNKPDGPLKGGLIVIHEVWGLVDHTKSVADRFAKEGYLVVAPSLLTENGLDPVVAADIQKKLFDPEHRNKIQPKIRELFAPMQAPEFAEKTNNKIKATFEYLLAQPETNGRVASLGFCFGGTYTFSLAVNEPRLKAAVPFYGHSDQPVEELKKINCPILAFYGENDENLMSVLPSLKTRMNEAEVDFTSVVYPNCGHAFFNDTNKFAYNQAAAEDAWSKATVFLSKYLK